MTVDSARLLPLCVWGWAYNETGPTLPVVGSAGPVSCYLLRCISTVRARWTYFSSFLEEVQVLPEDPLRESTLTELFASPGAQLL